MGNRAMADQTVHVMNALAQQIALPMAQPSQIEGRLRAILGKRERTMITKNMLLIGLATATIVLLPLAALRPVAQAAAALPRAGQPAQADKASIHPEIAVAQLKRIYGFLPVYRYRHGNAYPPEDLDLVLDVQTHPQAYGLPKRNEAENIRQVARCFTNDDTRKSEMLSSFYAWGHRKNPILGSIYYIQNRRLDGTLVGSAKPAGTRDLLAWTDLYVHGNPARGFYLTLWDDGRVERVPYDQILYAPRSLLKSRRAMTKAALKNYVCKPNAGGLLMAFPGQAGLPSNTLTHQEFNDALGVPRPRTTAGETR